ncbi:MAG: hypothetical protein NT069_29925 [Planctomycetota bacterium]|nr:hypothetical protein [Planctomycetota bacterium]
MLTGTLALLHRALRLDARLLSTHLFRLGFVVLVYFSLVHAQIQSLGLAGAPGLKLFSSMMYLNLGLIVLAGVSFFATAITEEKEEETLGLLRMAGLNPLALLLGKSTSRLIGTLLLLAVQIPFILLAVTLGGATIVQILAGYCTLASFLILTANMGLFASVACRRGGTASAVTVALFVLYFLGGPSFRPDSSGRFSAGRSQATSASRSPFFCSRGSVSTTTRIRNGSRSPRATSPRDSPVVWDFVARAPGSTRSCGRNSTSSPAECIFCWFVFWCMARSWELCVMLGLLVIEACLYASRLLHDEWREHTLPMLMMLPIPVHQILAAKLLGCIPALLPGLSWLVISLLLWNEGQDHLANMLLLPSYWFGALVFLLLLTLTLFFSLVVRWGALPLSIAVMLGAAFFGSCCFVPAYSLTQTASDSTASREAAFLVIDAIVVILIAGLQFDIHRRLEIAGSQ